jgi:uncharacterized membrane protein YwzB
MTLKLHEPFYASRRAGLIFKGTLAVFSLAMIYLGTLMDRGLENLAFVSHVGGMLSAVYFVLGFLNSLLTPPEDALLTRALSVVAHINTSVQFMIFVFYWALMAFDDFMKKSKLGSKTYVAFCLFVQIVNHLLFPLIMWFSLFLERTHFKRSNIWFMVAFSVLYSYLNAHITLASGVPVYDIIDWKSIGSHIHMALGLGLAFLGFFIAAAASKAVSTAFGYAHSATKTHKNK